MYMMDRVALIVFGSIFLAAGCASQPTPSDSVLAVEKVDFCEYSIDEAGESEKAIEKRFLKIVQSELAEKGTRLSESAKECLVGILIRASVVLQEGKAPEKIADAEEILRKLAGDISSKAKPSFYGLDVADRKAVISVLESLCPIWPFCE